MPRPLAPAPIPAQEKGDAMQMELETPAPEPTREGMLAYAPFPGYWMVSVHGTKGAATYDGFDSPRFTTEEAAREWARENGVSLL